MSFRLIVSFLMVSAFGLLNSVFAQDILILEQGDTLNVKVLEVGEVELQYKLIDNLDGPVFKKNVRKVQKVVFENGSEWTPEPDRLEKPEVIKRFDEKRAANKKLELINDSLPHHLVMVNVGVPELDFYFSTLIKLHAGVAYEWQDAKKQFGFRAMPIYTVELGFKSEVPENAGALGLSVSPRYYAVNKRSSQFYVGLDAQVSSFIPDPTKRTYIGAYNQSDPLEEFDVRWNSIQTFAGFVLGGHVTTKNKFDFNIELGVGHKYSGYKYTKELPDIGYFNRQSTGSKHFLTVFVRLAFGKRFIGKRK